MIIEPDGPELSEIFFELNLCFSIVILIITISKIRKQIFKSEL